MTNSTIQTHPTRRPDSVTLNESQPHAAFALHTVAPTTTWNSPEAITLIAGDCLLLAGKVWTYSVGSVVSYALESGDDPVAAVDRARANGHDLVWINQRAACLTSHREPRQALIVVDNGDLIRIEGKLYRIRLFDRVHIALDPFTPEA